MIDLSRPVDLSAPDFINDKYALYERIREEKPVQQVKISVMKLYAVSRYEDCEMVLKDADLSREQIDAAWFILNLKGKTGVGCIEDRGREQAGVPVKQSSYLIIGLPDHGCRGNDFWSAAPFIGTNEVNCGLVKPRQRSQWT